MPTVPRISTPRVQEEGLPGARNTPLPSADALGGGQSAATAFNAVDDAFQKIKRNADEVAVLDAQNRLSEWEQKKLYDAKEGLLVTRQGKDALGIADEVQVEYEKYTSEIENGLSGRSQQEAFRRLRSDKFNDINKIVQRHTTNEIEKYDDEQTQYGIKLEQANALKNFTDENSVMKSINKQSEMLYAFGKRKGHSQEWFDVENAKLISQTQVGVLDNIMTSDSAMADIAAQEYFDKHKDSFTEEDRPKVEKALLEKTLLGKATRKADEIFAKNKGSQVSALNELQKIEDPKEKSATRSLLNQYFNDLDGAKLQDEKTKYKFLYNELAKSGWDQKTLTKYASTLSLLEPSKQQDLRTLTGAVRGGKADRDSDPNIKYKLIDLMKTPEGFSELEKINLEDPEFKKKLSTRDWNYFDSAQKKGFNSDENNFSREVTKAFDNVYREAGFTIPSKKSAPSVHAEYNHFVEQVRAQMKSEGATSFEKATEISRRLTKERVLNKGFFNTSRSLFKARPEEIDVNDLDPTTVNVLKEKFQKRFGREPTELDIQTNYLNEMKKGNI